jgi:large subunit ribosomal protein L9
MQVLLLKDVPGLGHAGDVKEVAGGYAHNLLLPRKLAVPASEGALKQVKTVKDAAEQRRQRKRMEAKELLARLDGQLVTFKARAGEGERLYGSITNGDIAEALTKMLGTEIERRSVELEHPIKTLGEHPVIVKVGPGATATVRVRVERVAEES